VSNFIKIVCVAVDESPPEFMRYKFRYYDKAVEVVINTNNIISLKKLESKDTKYTAVLKFDGITKRTLLLENDYEELKKILITGNTNISKKLYGEG
jgi:hypothetical protein